MIRTTMLAFFAFALVLPTGAGAGELIPLQAGVFGLRDQTASVYYTVRDGQFEVVTTIASDGATAAPARCTAQLTPGQIATVSVGTFGEGGPATVLQLERKGDTLHADIVAFQLSAAQ